jgi:endonuclease YncB( thermonuclease family)
MKILLVLLISCSPLFAREYPADVLRIVDADTVEASVSLGFNIYVTEKIRFSGINAPERKTGSPHEKALKRLMELLSIGSKVTLITKDHDERDKYGRVLAKVIASGKDIGEILLKEKLVDPYNP